MFASQFKKAFNACLTFVIFALLATTTTHTLAQAFPSRPINVLVPFATGGQNDRIARLMAPYLQKYLGKNIFPLYGLQSCSQFSFGHYFLGYGVAGCLLFAEKRGEGS